MMITILTGLLLLAGIAWCGVCIPAKALLPDDVFLTVTAALLTVALIQGVTSLFLPEIPRMRRELGRVKEKGGAAAGIILLLAAGFLLVWDAAALAGGRPLLMGSLRTAALCCSVLALAGCLFCMLYAQLTLCWNEDGVLLRTCLGRLHRFGWDELTGYNCYHGVTRLYAGKRSFTIPGGRQQAFWQCMTQQRRRMGLPPLPNQSPSLW